MCIECKIKIVGSLAVLAWSADGFNYCLCRNCQRVACCTDFFLSINNFLKQKPPLSSKLQYNSYVYAVAESLDILFTVSHVVKKYFDLRSGHGVILVLLLLHTDMFNEGIQFLQFLSGELPVVWLNEVVPIILVHFKFHWFFKHDNFLINSSNIFKHLKILLNCLKKKVSMQDSSSTLVLLAILQQYSLQPPQY